MKKLLRHYSKFLMLLIALLYLSGCIATQRMALLDIKGASDRITKDDAYNKTTMILVDKGFDIKLGNKDLGLLTTEYKQFASVDSSPPFDFYLQIKTMIKDRPDGKIQVTLVPQVKESNRLNAAAFTEKKLVFLSDDEQKRYLTLNERATLKGQLLFMNVVHGVAEALGLGIEQFEQNTQLMQ